MPTNTSNRHNLGPTLNDCIRNCEIICLLHSVKPQSGNFTNLFLALSLSHTYTLSTHTLNREEALAHCSVQSCVSVPWWLEMIGSQTAHTAETPRYTVTSRPPGIKGTERRVFPAGKGDQQFLTLAVHRDLELTNEWLGFRVLECTNY